MVERPRQLGASSLLTHFPADCLELPETPEQLLRPSDGGLSGRGGQAGGGWSRQLNLGVQEGRAALGAQASGHLLMLAQLNWGFPRKAGIRLWYRAISRDPGIRTGSGNSISADPRGLG